MKKPPPKIDNAEVLYWAWAEGKPFGNINYSDGSFAAEVFGLAICQYENSDVYYRFSCDQNWESIQDFDYHSIEEAKTELPQQYRKVFAHWIKFKIDKP